MGRTFEPDHGVRRLPPEHFCPRNRCYVIADAGSNHCGQLGIARELIRVAKNAKCDAIKFQLFKWADIVDDPKRREKKFELPEKWIPELAQEARCSGLDFLCTPFSPRAAETVRPYVVAWKIGSFEALRKDLIEATDDKVRIISLGMVEDDERPKLMRMLPLDIFLHCVSRYPAPLHAAALDRMKRMRRVSRLVGLSDHFLTRDGAVACMALGARTFEKHIKIAVQPDSPDNGPWALGPEEMKEYVRTLRELEIASRRDEFDVPEKVPHRLVHRGERVV